MASRADSATRALSSSGNVTRLSTAAPRKVQQNHNRFARAAKAELPRFPGKYMRGSQRDMMRLAETLRPMFLNWTPERELLVAILTALDDNVRAKVVETLAPGVASDRHSALQAYALFRSTRLTVGQSIDLDYALAQLGASA